MFGLVCILWVGIKLKWVFFFWVWHFVSMGFVLLVRIKFKWDLFDLEEED